MTGFNIGRKTRRSTLHVGRSIFQRLSKSFSNGSIQSSPLPKIRNSSLILAPELPRETTSDRDGAEHYRAVAREQEEQKYEPVVVRRG